ncbi:MAG: peptidylprolyl isomerase [Pyrinomonadaceae bacterium]|nr:peptidylprolyl isomerase [Pyrinomonadaceae bacterium]
MFPKKVFLHVVLFVAVLTNFVAPAFAQESEPVVVDEVIAQVNNGYITLSRVKTEMKSAVESLVATGKTREEAQREVDSKKNELIASLINEEVLLQQGKDLNFDSEVEGEVRGRFLAIMKEQNYKTLEELYTAMKAQGIQPDDIKATLRKDIMKQMVLNQEVDRKIYLGLKSAELKSYYDSNPAKFKKPETITLSEIYLSFAARNKTEVQAKANQIVTQLRGGANFQTLVEQFSEREESKKNNGKVDTLDVSTLDKKFADALKNVKAGGVSDPIADELGVIILRVDARSANSGAPTFDEDRVRRAMLDERGTQERKKYLAGLRKEAYIKISPSYDAIITPILKKDTEKN